MITILSPPSSTQGHSQFADVCSIDRRPVDCAKFSLQFVHMLQSLLPFGGGCLVQDEFMTLLQGNELISVRSMNETAIRTCATTVDTRMRRDGSSILSGDPFLPSEVDMGPNNEISLEALGGQKSSTRADW